MPKTTRRFKTNILGDTERQAPENWAEASEKNVFSIQERARSMFITA